MSQREVHRGSELVTYLRFNRQTQGEVPMEETLYSVVVAATARVAGDQMVAAGAGAATGGRLGKRALGKRARQQLVEKEPRLGFLPF